LKVKNVKIWQYIKEIRKLLPYINGNKKIIKRYKGTDLVFDSTTPDTGTTDTLSFEFTGTSLTYKLNNTNYTATSSPYSTTLSDLGIEELNSCNGTFMGGILKGITNLTSFPDTSNVTDMGSMFYFCSGLISLDLSSFVTSNVTNMSSMFAGCIKLTSLDASSWDVEQVTSYSNMFLNCTSLTELIIKEGTYAWWCARLTEAGISCDIIEVSVNSGTNPIITENTLSFKYLGLTNSNVTINGTLYQITAADGEPLGDDYYKYTTTLSEPLTSLSFDNGNVFELYAIPQTTDVTSFNSMFTNSQLTELNLSGLDTSNVTDMSYMFSNCDDLAELNVSGWDISNVASTTYMFRNCNNLTKLIIGEDGDYGWWYSRLTDDGIQNNVTIV